MPLPKTIERRIDQNLIGASHQASLAAVAEALSTMRYGAVHLTVHDGRVVQLDVTERQRFT
jgi:hypothetical protein